MKSLILSVILTIVVGSDCFSQYQQVRENFGMAPAKNNEQKSIGLQAMVNQIANTLKFRVQFEKYNNKSAKVLIQQEGGKILYKHTVYKTKYIGRFDLSTAKDGIYHFIISTDSELYKRSFCIRSIDMRTVTNADDYPPLVQRIK